MVSAEEERGEEAQAIKERGWDSLQAEMNLMIREILFTHKNLGRFIKCMARQVRWEDGRRSRDIDEMADALKFGGVRIWTLCPLCHGRLKIHELGINGDGYRDCPQRGLTPRVGVEKN